MPIIARLPGAIKICMYHNDHDPPHFHAERAEMAVQVRIADLVVMRGSIRSADLLIMRYWAMARAGMQIEKIVPP